MSKTVYPDHVQTAIDKALKGEAQQRGRVVRGSGSGVLCWCGNALKAGGRCAACEASKRPPLENLMRMSEATGLYDAPPIAKGRIAKPRGMTRIEEQYGAHLLAELAAGMVLWYRYEGITLKLADDTRYTPDFFVLTASGVLECIEVKGPFRREDSFVKLKVAASIYPFAFRLVTREGDGWKTVEVKA